MELLEYTNENKNKIKEIINRNTANFDDALSTAREIMEDVRNKGDSALFKYTEKFDRFNLNSKNLVVSEEELVDAYKRIKENNKNTTILRVRVLFILHPCYLINPYSFALHSSGLNMLKTKGCTEIDSST